MTFISPYLLMGLALVPILCATYLFAQRRRRAYAVRFTNLALLKKVVGKGPGARRHIPPLLFLIGLAALLISLARPVAVLALPREQSTVMLVMDVSASMTAADMQPNRMEAARQAARTFVENLPPHVSVGLATFNDRAALAAPITRDHEMVLNAIDAVQARGGTAIGDGTLWYFEAVRAFAEKTNDYEFVFENLYEKLINIILWHSYKTRFQIFLDADGLLHAGEKGVQLTWMDAKIGDLVITPRTGKAVEIQALWYNALCIMADFAERFGDKKDREKYLEMADNAKKSFNEIFWNEEEECLFDVIDGENKDASVRPNQLFAVSLPNTMLSIGKAQKIVKKVEAELLTPVGLRSLSPKDSRYCPIYTGSPFDRDSAYHQGTVWAWLIGSYIDAYRKVNSNGRKTDESIREILEGFKDHLGEAGLGQISEIFDGDAPHKPRGCIAQAWSVAEVLRVIKSDSGKE